jgi:hypothetical protein
MLQYLLVQQRGAQGCGHQAESSAERGGILVVLPKCGGVCTSVDGARSKAVSAAVCRCGAVGAVSAAVSVCLSRCNI